MDETRKIKLTLELRVWEGFNPVSFIGIIPGIITGIKEVISWKTSPPSKIIGSQSTKIIEAEIKPRDTRPTNVIHEEERLKEFKKHRGGGQ